MRFGRASWLPFWLTAAAIGCALCAAPPRAHAWDGPLCAFPEDSLSTLPPERAPVPSDAAMCGGEPTTPALVPAPTAPITVEEAIAALTEVRRLASAGEPLRALVVLGTVEHYAPEVEDRFALLRGELSLAAGDPVAACIAYPRALTSLDRSVGVRAEVGMVRCLLGSGERRGERALVDLRARYPELPDTVSLEYALAIAKRGWGERTASAALLRSIDLEEPGSPAAALAREALGSLSREGVRTTPFDAEERVARAERLVRSGPMDAARSTVEALRNDRALTAPLRAKVALLAARIARVEGRFDEARTLAREASNTPDTAAAEAAASTADELAENVTRRAQNAARVHIQAIARGRSLTRCTALQLGEIVELAARAGLAETANDALTKLDARTDATAALRLSASIVASGVADDALLARVLLGATGDGTVGVAARYHRARALERLGEKDAAVAELRRVRTTDHSELHWYALWAEQRLDAYGVPRTTGTDDVATAPPSVPLVLAALEPGALDTSSRDGTVAPPTATDAPQLDATNTDHTDSLARATALLEPLARLHGTAYPWLRRALVLTRLGETEWATDELFEAVLAYRQARNLPLPNAGLEAVYRGGPPRRAAIDQSTRRARATLPESARTRLADIAALLGDPGVAVAFGGRDRAADRPRAYEDAVVAAAAQQGLDPALLFAVMRVESVYNRRIVSYAGAVGLLQIMPRTGQLVAESMGRDDFTTADLLDPEKNLEMAAWYLASLLRRFDGRLPLAIAAYNGGPHNVRRWMEGYEPTMPLDAFLERIPFEQTFRYVRRVLGHYAAYRAQRGEPMVALDITLPQPAADTVAF
jgi:soluble lytic murein transglycosylase